MRQLRFARPRTSSEAAEAAEALRWLERQAVPAGLSADVEARFRYLVAVARQHQNRGVSLGELVEMGWRAGLVGADSWGWRVREGMVETVANNNNF